MAAELSRILELLQLPFMQRAMLGGVLMGVTGGLLGSFAIVRQLSFFSDALGHSSLLGIVLGILLGVDPMWVLLPFGVLFALGVTTLLERTQLAGLAVDAVLNIIYSSSLAISVIALTFVKSYRGNLNQLLFGDILGIGEIHLWMSGFILLLSLAFLGFTLRSQLLLTLNQPLAKAQGVSTGTHRLIFVVVLSLMVALSIRAIGVLLVSAFIVIPASTARLLAQGFVSYMMMSMLIGGSSAVLGMIGSAAFNLPSGPSIVATQLILFLLAMGVSSFRQNSRRLS